MIAASTLDNKEIDNVNPTLSKEEKKVKRAFRKCAYEIWVSHKKAVEVSADAADVRAPLVVPAAPSEIEVVLSDIMRKLDEDDDILASDCGKIAKCIIMVWVKLATLISWSDRATGHVDENSVYHPPLLKELPYMSA